MTTIIEEKTVTSKRRENIILSSFLFNKECREFVVQHPLEPSTFSSPDVKKMIIIFNGIIRSGMTPHLDMLIEQHFPVDKDEDKRQNLRNKLQLLKSKTPPVELDLFKEHIHLMKRERFLSSLQIILGETGKKIQSEISNPSFQKDNASINFLHTELDSLMETYTPDEIKSFNLGDGLMHQIDNILERRKNPEISNAVTTGFKALDDILAGGFQKGNFALISARPAMGKTVTMLNLGLEAAKKGKKVLFVSIEMSLVQCLQRILSKVSSVKMKKILEPRLLNDSEIAELKRVAKEVNDVYGKNFFIEEVTTINPTQLENRIKFYQKNFGVELVFVDYLQIMRTKEGKQPKEVSDYSALSSDIRELAKSLNIALVLGAQLSRDVEKRDDKRPMDSDLKNSGSFEQDAATLIHLYRDVVYNPDTEDKNILEVIIGKNRFGASNVPSKFACDYSTQSIGEPVILK